MKNLFIIIAFAILLSGCATNYEGPKLGRVMDTCEATNKEFNSYYNCIYNTWYTPMYNELKDTTVYADNSDLIDLLMNTGKLLKIKVNKGQMSYSEATLRWDITRQEIDLLYNQRDEARRARIMAIGAALSAIGNNSSTTNNNSSSSDECYYCRLDFPDALHYCNAVCSK